MGYLDRRCIIDTCHKQFRAEHPDVWTCSAECYSELQVIKKTNSDEAEELGKEESRFVGSMVLGETEAEKARQALTGLNEAATVAEAGKALYRPPEPIGPLELAEIAHRLHDLAVKAEKRNWDYSEEEPQSVYVRAFPMIADQLISECLEGIRVMLTPTLAVGGPSGHDSEVVRPTNDIPPDDEAGFDEEGEAGDFGEGEDPGGYPEAGLGSDPGVLQGDLGDGVPGDGVDDGPTARGGR